MERLRMSYDGWSQEPVLLARTRRERRRGLRGQGRDVAMLIETASVHGFGMRRPFRAVGLTAEGVAIASKVVAPRRLAWFPGCRWVLELPVETPPPPPRSRVEVRRALR